MRNASLFAKTVEKTTTGFGKDSYSDLGQLIHLQEPVVSEDELVFIALFPGYC